MTKYLIIYVLLFSTFSSKVYAESNSYISEIAQLDIQDLMEQEVSSVLRKEQSLSNAAAAVFVITSEDIRRSGSRSLPELLRMVPGITVTRLRGGDWQVTARGFDSNGTSKLLVLIDGRSVYSPVFSGVFWDAQDVIAEDIERIEVIRGPGAVSWGENAVNGVINVITKHSQELKGTRIIAGATDKGSASTSLSFGDSISETTSYRIFGKYAARDNLRFGSGKDADDESRIEHGGFRIDSNPSKKDSLTIQGDIYDGSNSLKSDILTSFIPPFTERKKNTTDIGGGNILLRWKHEEDPSSQYVFQTYYDRTERNNLTFGEERDTYDVDLQHHYKLSRTHDLVYGANYRITSDEFDNSFSIKLIPEERTDQLFNAFIQDEITIVPEKWSIIPGIKAGYNDYSYFDYQPALKLLWTPSPSKTAWASASRAIRSPARIDEDIYAYGVPTLGDNGIPQVPAVIGSKDFDAEGLHAYEIGYRSQISDSISADITAFYFQYQDLLSITQGSPFDESVPAPTHTIIPFILNNRLHGEAYGTEAYTQWKLTNSLDLGASYSFIQLNFEPDPGSADFFGDSIERRTPQNQASAKLHWNLDENFDFNAIAYYVDAIPTYSVPSYIRADLHLGYKINNQWLLDFAVQNLIGDGHREWETEEKGVKIDRTFYVKFTYNFR